MDNKRLLRIGEATEVLGISKSTFYNRINDGSFPKGIKISEGCTRWRAEDIYHLFEKV